MLYRCPRFWLTQANYIFSRLQISSSFEDYVVIQIVEFELVISTNTVYIPDGFLFLCPEKEFRTGPSSFKWPECPAYWSLDPTGAERLGKEDSTNLGFPSLQFSMTIRGRSWDPSVYAGLRHFHQAKGFDPDSQDIARHLRHELYQIPGEVDTPFSREHEDCDSFNPDGDPGAKNMSASASKINEVDHSTADGDGAEALGLPDELSPVSWTFNVQIILMIFIALSQLYDQV
ncbi:hypothetical protein B0H19DRAFT_1197520 [Mycena capillaripes]|nr:hypothetical protein B0H19DRAFT_1197520 [Mycena capillaripes]